MEILREDEFWKITYHHITYIVPTLGCEWPFNNHDLDITFFMTVTCPRYPAVPLSIKGMSAAKHILFTWFRAADKNNMEHQIIFKMFNVADINT